MDNWAKSKSYLTFSKFALTWAWIAHQSSNKTWLANGQAHYAPCMPKALVAINSYLKSYIVSKYTNHA